MRELFLSRFTPSLLTHETLEAIFVQRQALVDRLVELTRASVLTDDKHYSLLIGSRGIGKTHLVSLVYYRIRQDADVGDRLLIAWLREEEWGVASFLDLLCSILRALHEEYEDSQLAEDCRALRNLGPEQAELEAEQVLRRTVGERTLLLLAENLDGLFESIGEQGQHKLRAYFSNNPFFTMVATSQSLFNGVSLRTSPFYGFFQIHHLPPFSFEDAVSLLAKVAKLEGDEKLVSFVQTPLGRARIRAVHHLAAGNPRVYVIFFQFLTCESLEHLVQPLLQTLDDLTPYYQARMALLAPQQRKIAELLCDRRHAVPVNEIARSCFITHQTASAQLRKLRELGYVQSHQSGRESHYELREPLMRIALDVKRCRGEPLRLFVEFLRLWYSQAELSRRTDEALAACDKAIELDENDVISWCDRASLLDEQGQYGEALACYERGLQLEPNSSDALNGRAIALYRLGRLEDSLAALDRALELEPDSARLLANHAVALSSLGRHEEAIASFDRAIELDPTPDFHILSNRAVVKMTLGRWQEGLLELDQAVASVASDAELAADRGKVAIVRNLLVRTRDETTWRRHIAVWVELFAKHNLISALGQGLVRSIHTLGIPWISDEAAASWCRVWKELAGHYPGMELPLRFLDTAVEYQRRPRKTVLLRLPIEERELIEPLIRVMQSVRVTD